MTIRTSDFSSVSDICAHVKHLGYAALTTVTHKPSIVLEQAISSYSFQVP